MKKKLLILLCAMMMLMFGSVLTVSAEETVENTTYWVSVDHLYYNTPGTGWYHGTARFEYSSSFRVAGFLWCAPGADSSKSLCLYFMCKNENGVNSNLQMPVVEREILDSANLSQTVIDNFYPLSSLRNCVPYNLRYLSGANSDKYVELKCSTNMPVFSSSEECINYLNTGDLTGNLNDLTDTDKMDEDSSFGFTGFTAGSTGKLGAIKASWTGTTHDDKIDTYKEAKYTVHAAYAWKNDIAEVATPIASVTSNMFRGDISELGFLKMYSYFTPENENTYLRYLKVVPYYTVGDGLFGVSKKGLPVTIWLDENGYIENVDNDIHDENPEVFEDMSFSLNDVSVKKGATSLLTGELSEKISWSGSTKDNVIKNIALDKTYISVFFYGSTADGDIKLYDYEDVYKNSEYSFPLRIHSDSKYVGNSFEFMTQQMIDICESENRTFMGEVWLTPYYTVDNCIYKGKVTVVNVLTYQVGEINPDEPEEPVYPDEPSPDEPSPDVPSPDFPNIDDISDVIPYFISLIKYFIQSCGEIPMFLSRLFPLIPSDISYMLTVGLVCALILRIVGR